MPVKRLKIFSFLLGSHSARDAALITACLTACGKAMGYVRTLLAAYFFGASAFVDSYYVALGSVLFVTSTIGSTVESAVLPKMVKGDGQTARALFSWTLRAVAAVAAIISSVMLIFPSCYIKLFAASFDEARLKMAADMVKWVLPFALALLAITVLSVWANYKDRFTALSTVTLFSNVLSIPSLLLLVPLLGDYALPAFQGPPFIILALCLWRVLGDVPIRKTQPVPRPLVRSAARDAGYCLAGTGAAYLYTLTDRYFAASLPAGNVAAISYAQLIFSQPIGLLGAAMSIYLVKASRALASREEAEDQLFTTLYMAFSYLFPASLLLSILSRQTVAILLGYGAFDAEAVALTAPCLAVMALGIPAMVWMTALNKYAQASGRLKMVTLWNYAGIAGNVLLDWLLVRRFGAAGLCAATALMWGASSVFFMLTFAPGMVRRLIRAAAPQCAAAAAWGMPFCLYVSGLGMFLPIAAGALLLAFHMALCERLGFFRDIPQSWRPGALCSILLRRLCGGK